MDEADVVSVIWLNHIRRWFGMPPLLDPISKRIREEQSIFVDTAGFGVRRKDGGNEWIAWDEIDAIQAWKEDLLTTDELRVEFSDKWGDRIVVSEEHLGYQELIAALSRRFAGIEKQLADILIPPFARNETTLFERGR